ncbi:hypothetical protein ISN45_Aa04g011850 [Arabidopsis thaliana x Arabidopsis arenosa]|uniref:Uncharacterized protein n=1 Tax=Arabidopsis thaliana x Arabidopsis arenosa TaxID=1240361 RepID=A0A8T2A9I0_9BRAS|nr:hypothetical protein ISN45_Aa04g011850 [Arabidopsis thaliana x Arabidopsis arenosa]
MYFDLKRRCLLGVVLKPIVCSQTSDFEDQGSVASVDSEGGKRFGVVFGGFKRYKFKSLIDDFYLDLPLSFERLDCIKFGDGKSHCLRDCQIATENINPNKP